MRFLGDPTVGFVNKTKNILFVFVLYALYIFAYTGTLEWLFENQLFNLFSALILAPVVEEVIFRVGPIGLVKDKPHLILPTIILSSALFGYLHYGPQSWLVQGVMGFILSLIYLKNGRSYWSAVLLHFLWNSYCVFILEKLN